MKINTIIHGHCLDVLKTLPDKSVNCCITSPPYWGLRDYGTETWDGGDENCDHIKTFKKHEGQRADRNQEGCKILHKDICSKCGAKRIDSQLGLEKTPEEYVTNMVQVFRAVKRILRDDGTLWLNIGDSYAASSNTGGTASIQGTAKRMGAMTNKHHKIPFGMKPKDLVGIPWMVAFALRADGWYLRQDIIWHKPNPMPESVTDRCTKAHEYIFLMAKSQKYYYDANAIREPFQGKDESQWAGCYQNEGPIIQGPSNAGIKRTKRYPKNYGGGGAGFNRHKGYLKADGTPLCDPEIGRNKRSVWTVTTKPYQGAHFAVYPPDLIVPCIKAGCPEGGIVLDPFIGAGTTAIVARKLGRNYIGIELNKSYIKLAEDRIYDELGIFSLGST